MKRAAFQQVVFISPSTLESLGKDIKKVKVAIFMQLQRSPNGGKTGVSKHTGIREAKVQLGRRVPLWSTYEERVTTSVLV